MNSGYEFVEVDFATYTNPSVDYINNKGCVRVDSDGACWYDIQVGNIAPSDFMDLMEKLKNG